MKRTTAEMLQGLQAEAGSVDETVADGRTVFRNVLEIPDTPTAQKSLGALIRATQDVGYAAIAKAVGHDKSWITRWYGEESRANLPEVLRFLDACGLRIVPADGEREEESELMQILLRKVAVTIERRRADHSLDGARIVQLDVDEYKALLAFAEIGVKSRQTGLDRCCGGDCAQG